VKWAHSSKINDSFGMHAHVLVLSFLLLIILKLEKTVKISLLFQDFFLKPRLHVRFFACDGYVIFLKLSRHQRAAKITCSHPLTKFVILSQKIQLIEFLVIFPAIFSSIASPVQGWLHMRFSPRAGDATTFQKMASPWQAKNRSCSRGFKTEIRH